MVSRPHASIVGIIVALPQEARTLTSSPIRCCSILPLQPNLYLGVGGMGANSSYQMAHRLIAQGATRLISWGTAGGINPVLKPGDLVIPEQIILLAPNLQQSLPPLTTDTHWRSHLLTQLATTKLTINDQPLLQTETIIDQLATKKALYETYTAAAIDMESYAIAQVAHSQGLPFIAIRTIIDPASMTLPKAATQAYDSNGQLQIVQLLAALLKNPREWGSLYQLSQHLKQAQASLRQVATLDGIFSPIF